MESIIARFVGKVSQDRRIRVPPRIKVEKGKEYEIVIIERDSNSTIPSEDFLSLLKVEYDLLKSAGLRGGLVTIPELWQRLQGKVSRSLFERYLLQMESLQIVDLQVASDRRLVKDPKQGINHPKRGLIYFLSWR